MATSSSESSSIKRYLRALVRKGTPHRLLLLLLLLALVLWPLASLMWEGLANNAGGVRAMLSEPLLGQSFWLILKNTFILALGSLVIAFILGFSLAYCVATISPRIQRYVTFLPVLVVVMPAIVSTTGWVFLLSPKVGYLNVLLRKLPFWSDLASGPVDIFTLPWIVILTGINLSSFVYLYVWSSMETLGTELGDAAAISGAGPYRVLRTITVPLIRPALVYASGVVLLLGVGQFTNPLLLGRTHNINVLTTVMYNVTREWPVRYDLGAALAMPLILLGAVVMVLQRRAIGNQARYAVVTGKSNKRPRAGSVWPLIPLLVYLMAAVLLPVTGLIIVALSPYWSGDIQWGRVGLTNFSEVLADPRTVAALSNTLQVVAVALLVVLAVGFFVSLALRRSAGRLNQGIDLVSLLPFAMPPVIFGFAILHSFAASPFFLYGTTTIIVIAYIVLMIPHSVRPQLSSMLSVGPEYGEASRVGGAGWLRTLARIELPMIRRGIAAASAIVVVLLFHEFSAALMVRTDRTDVLGTLLYDHYTGGTYPSVAVLSLLMAVVTALGIFVALLSGGRRVLQ